MREGITVAVSASDRARLEAIVANRSSWQKHVWRARIVLLTADGLGTNEIMREAGISKSPVCLSLHADIRFLAQCRRGVLRQANPAAPEARRFPFADRSAGRDQSLRRRDERQSQAFHLDDRSRQHHRRRQTRVPNVRFDPLEF